MNLHPSDNSKVPPMPSRRGKHMHHEEVRKDQVRLELALRTLQEWWDKTDWLQTKDLPAKYLGWHKADIMRDMVESKDREIQALREQLEAIYLHAEQIKDYIDKQIIDDVLARVASPRRPRPTR